MSAFSDAARQLTSIDSLASLKSPVHRIHPLVKLIVTLAYIVLLMSLGRYNLSSVLLMIIYPLVLFAISGISVCLCIKKLRFVLPLVAAVGLFNPFFDRAVLFTVGAFEVTGGMISFVTLLLKGTFALMATFILIATTGIEGVCYALRLIHVPKMIVTVLHITYRYIGLLIDEAASMSEAYALRAPGQKGVHISAWGSFLGQLLIRSMDRAKEVYEAMELRGFDGEYHTAYHAAKRSGKKDG